MVRAVTGGEYGRNCLAFPRVNKAVGLLEQLAQGSQNFRPYFPADFREELQTKGYGVRSISGDKIEIFVGKYGDGGNYVLLRDMTPEMQIIGELKGILEV